MNWREIKSKCELAYQLCDKWTNSSTLEPFYERGNWSNRNLYDFFDNNKIRVEIKIREHGTFSPSISVYNGKWEYVWLCKPKETRPESEIVVFSEAFKILNDKIKI